MLSKLGISPSYKWGIPWGEITHLPTIDPIFLGHPSRGNGLFELSQAPTVKFLSPKRAFLVRQVSFHPFFEVQILRIFLGGYRNPLKKT